MKTRILFILFYLPINLFAYTWNVGASQTYATPSAVANLVLNGDTIKIDGGIYLNDQVTWSKSNLVFIGLGTGSNRTTMKWNAGDISNGKGIWVFADPSVTGNITIDNIVFEGAKVSDTDGGNGAGVRYQAANLTIKNCLFHSCQNGILEGGSYTGSTISIQNSEFYNNGYEVTGGLHSGYEHNIYISAQTDSLLVQNCYFHDPRGEANSLKTRAQRSFILYNVIDEAAGEGSWEINIAQGGLNVILGNVIIQGANSINHGIIGYDGATNAIEDFYFINNTVINKYSGAFNCFNVLPTSGINVFKIYNNIFTTVAAGTLNNFIVGTLGTALDTLSNRIISDYTTVGFLNALSNDFHITSTSTSVLNNASNAGAASNNFSLLPVFEYAGYTLPLIPRFTSGSSNDIGAYEYALSSSVNTDAETDKVVVWTDKSSIYLTCGNKEISNLFLYDISGKLIQSSYSRTADQVTIPAQNLNNGIYFIEVKTGNQKMVKKFFLKK